MRATPRSEVFDAYWRFAAERQAIFHRRLAGAAGAPAEPPYTEDPILATYKFTNAYRASDRVSQFLIGDVIYADGEWTVEDVALRTILFRLFSKERTWRGLQTQVGEVRAAAFDVEDYAAALEELKVDGPIYTSAFILCANDAFGEPSKHRNHLRLVDLMLSEELPRRITDADSLEEVNGLLRAYPLIGSFMAYQLAVDLNYSELIDFSEDDFTVPGPGAERGLRKVFIDFGGHTKEELIMYMVDSQEEHFERLGIDFQDLFGRRLHAIDAQNLFCETDKYARVAYPELKSARTQIKARFTPDPEPIQLFYPPKWGINGAAAGAIGATARSGL